MVVFQKRAPQGDLSQVTHLKEELGVSSVVARLLCLRGYDEVEQARTFFQPDITQWHDPYLFEQMQDAVDCILAAGSMGLRICVYGDYDCDGICATALLSRFLASMDFEVLPYIPSRHDNGYGLSCDAIDQLAEQGVELIITVDCGITAVKEVAYAYEKGMEVIITDHHQCPPELPQCEAILNPTMQGAYPFASLCGAGMAFKLVQAIGGLEAALPYMDMVTIATVADIVALRGENRAIVWEGLRRMRSGRLCAGTRALVEVAGLEREQLDAQDIAFSIAPRINAMGRTGSAHDSLRLFLTDDEAEVSRLAQTLNQENRKRKAIERQILQEAEEKIRAGEVDLCTDRAILLESQHWNVGVIGIVASRLVRRYHRPVLLLAGDGPSLTGSGRSLRGIHLHDELARFRDRFERFGGHEMAAGLTLQREEFAAFRQDFLAHLGTLDANRFTPMARYDIEAERAEITPELLEELEQLGPFGTENPSPVFLLRNVVVEQLRSMGAQNEHIRFVWEGLECVAFDRAQDARLWPQERLDLLVQLEKNTFRGMTRLQVRMQDWRVAQPTDITTYIAERRHLFLGAMLTRLGQPHQAAPLPCFPALAEQQMKECAQDRLRNDPQGTLLLAFSPEGAAALLAFMQEKGLVDAVNLRWREWQEDCAYNTALLAPQLDRCRLEGFTDIMVWDGVFDQAAAQALAASGATVTVAAQADGAWLKELALTREELIPVYKRIVAKARQQRSFADWLSYESVMCEEGGLAPYVLRYALQVFSELAFLSLDKTVPFSVTVRDNAPQRDLTQSKTHQAALLAWENWKNMTPS